MSSSIRRVVGVKSYLMLSVGHCHGHAETLDMSNFSIACEGSADVLIRGKQLPGLLAGWF